MTATSDIKQVGRDYSRKFDNLDEVGHLSIIFRPEFGELMQKRSTADPR